MSGFRFSVGNLVARAPLKPAAASPSAEDAVFPVSNLGSGWPDEPGRWAWNSAGTYRADLDLNLLETASDRTEAPTGWSDLALHLAGTPGIGPNPPEYGAFGASNDALKAFRPVYQDFEVMPGETVKVQIGLFLPDADGSTVTRVWAVLVDLQTGLQYDGTALAWNSSGDPLAETTTDDAWFDADVSVPANVVRKERSHYRLIFGMDDAGPFGAGTYAYFRGRAVDLAPQVVGPLNVAALIGHDVQFGATVTVAENGGEGGPSISLTPAVPSFFGYSAAEAPQYYRFWRLQVQNDADLLVTAERPYVGELWLGTIQDLAWCPAFPFVIDEEDLSQVRLAQGGHSVASRGRRAFTVEPRAASRIKMKFRANEAGYRQVRDVIQGATRYGVDPMLFLPNSALEGEVVFHGRVDKVVSYSRENLARRGFEVNVEVSPFPVVPA